MTLRFSRPLSEMRPVLMDPNSTGPDPVYIVHQDLDNGWINKTELVAGKYGDEYAKTFGHVHLDGKDETYFVESGSGLILMQSPTEFLIKKVSPGEKYTIPHQYEHCLVNTGNEPLVTYDDHQNPQSNYKVVEEKHGLAYYIVEQNGQPITVPNPNYENLPQPQWLTIDKFKHK